MIAAIQLVFNSVYNFFTGIWQYLGNGLYNSIVWAYTQWIEFYTLASLKAQLIALTFAWDIAQSILVDLQISQKLQSFFSLLPSDVAVNVAALRIPEGIGLILTAYVTRYVLRFIPGGR